jgi:hypothetical protein
MKWHKIGLVFDTTKHSLPLDCESFAQSPQTLLLKDRVRVYFSSRKTDNANGKFLSHICWVDFDPSFQSIIQHNVKPVIPLGDLGSFDEHGIFPISITQVDQRILAYTCGWNRRSSVSVDTATGLAESFDGGQSFEKFGNGPILAASLHEPMLVGDSFVRKFGNNWHMWYIFGQRWLPATSQEPPARVYKIAHAISENGIDWIKNEGHAIIADVLHQDECQALPSVAYFQGKYHMVFCFREATDFRTNPLRGYRLGYAWSIDLLTWHRDDSAIEMPTMTGDWDHDMRCYPHFFVAHDKLHLLYNGNQFGRGGFGLAICDSL